MKKNDILWKGFMEDFFQDFLLFFYPDAEAIFDWDKGFEFLDKELQQLFPQPEDLRYPKYVDTLVKVFTRPDKKGQTAEHWILVHVEVQGYRDKNFTERLFTYFYRIRDRYGMNVTTFALLTDQDKSFRPQEYVYDFMGTSHVFRFNTFKVIDQDLDELNKSNNPFAIAILTVLIALKKRKNNEMELLKLSKDLIRNLFRKNLSKEKIAHLLNFIKMYVNFENPDVISKFDEEVKLISNNQSETMGIREQVLHLTKLDGIQEGIEKGMEKGMEKGIEIGNTQKEIAVTRSLIAETSFDNEKIAQLVGVSSAFVQDLRTRVLNEKK